MKQDLEKKLDHAEKKREENLQQVKNVAQLSAEKKNKNQILSHMMGESVNAHDNIPLPTH